MNPSRIVKKVYDEHIRNFGEPDESWVYEDEVPRPGFPQRIDVFVWGADAECDVTTFSTIGMSDQEMKGAKHRAELHFSIRKNLTKEQMGSVTLFIANLAMHPFHTDSCFDWHHTILDPGRIPHFNEAQSVWLHPAFVDDGWEVIKSGFTKIHLLNILPITRAEYDLKCIEERSNALSGLDVFAPR